MRSVPSRRALFLRLAASTGILDGIANVAAAYSLRKLRSAYAGSAVRVRRSSDSTEQDIGFDGSGEFDSAAFSSFVGGGTGYVRTWYDQSGNGKDVAQSATGDQPTIALSTANGYPVVVFGSSRLINATFSLPQPTHISVVRITSTPKNAVILDSYNNTQCAFYASATENLYRIAAGTALTSAVVNTNRLVHSVVFDSTDVHRISGVVAVTGNAGSNGFDGLSVGNIRGNTSPVLGGYDLAGDIAEIIILSAAISTTNHNTIGNNMATRYGLTWSNV